MESDVSDDSINNFEALANVIDTKYSYIDLKGVNWDSIVSSNRRKIKAGVNVIEEFDIYNEMLFELRDGHVNLNSGFDISRNWEWYLDAPTNFDWNVIERNYLDNDYFISGGLRHRILEDNRYGYVYYGSFSSGMQYIDFVKHYFDKSDVEGMIIDVRNNGGGKLSNAEDLASQFTDEKRVAYITYRKVGPGYTDFSQPVNEYIEPAGYKWTKPIVILTNRKCYSATSFFVTMMKELPNVYVLGDDTGGGAGLPVDYTLPNGWYLRYSTTRATNTAGEDFELGVKPHEYMDLDESAVSFGYDNLIERAKEIISAQ